MKRILVASYEVVQENKTVIWNRQEIAKLNRSIQSDIKLLNGLQQILQQEVLNVFVQRVKKEYGISVPDVLLLNQLREIVPYFNTKEVEHLTWKAIRRKMNVIMYLFQCIQNIS